MNFLFSVIIPTFNSAANISVVLDSIATQTEKDVEIVIMDGLSSDNTVDLAQDFKERIPGLKIFRDKDDGIYDAMNKAMDKASGKWLFFMGSDDRFYDDTVLEAVARVAALSKASVIYGNVKIIGDTGWARDADIYDGEFDIHKLLNQNICHQAMFYHSEFIKNEIGYFSLKYKKSSDWDFNLRCWAKGSFQYVDMIIANFAAGGFSTHSNDTAIFEDFVNNVRSYFKLDLFHPILNNPKFVFFGNVVKRQREEHPLRWKFERLKKRIYAKLRRFLK